MAYEPYEWNGNSYVTPSRLNNLEAGVQRVDAFAEPNGKTKNAGTIDANAITETSFMLGKGTNLPDTTSNFYLQTIAVSDTAIKQTATNASNGKEFIRKKGSSGWSAWDELASNSDLTEKIDKSKYATISIPISTATGWIYSTQIPSYFTKDNSVIFSAVAIAPNSGQYLFANDSSVYFDGPRVGVNITSSSYIGWTINVTLMRTDI